MSITYCECGVVVLGIQNAMRMRRVILLFVACSAVQIVSTSSHKTQDFRERNY